MGNETNSVATMSHDGTYMQSNDASMRTARSLASTAHPRPPMNPNSNNFSGVNQPPGPGHLRQQG